MITNNTRAACVYITDAEGNILAVSRKDNKTSFGLPGGKVEENETSMQAAIRETLEETGYHIILDPWSPFGMIDTNKNLTITFKATIDTSKPREILSGDETGVVKFISSEELLKGSFKEYNEEMLKYFNKKV